MARLRVNLNGLRRLGLSARELERQKFELYKSVLKELAARLLRKVILRTPVGVKPDASQEILAEHWSGYVGGTLRRGWTASTEEQAVQGTGDGDILGYLNNLEIKQEGRSFYVIIRNACSYASYVEYGHRQDKGRYVAQLGKRLVNSFVPGQYMLKISEDELARQAPAIIERKVESFIRGLLS